MLNLTMGCLHHAGHWPAIRVTEVAHVRHRYLRESSAARGHFIDRIYRRFEIRALVKMCCDRPDRANFLFARRWHLRPYHPKPRAVTSIAYREVRLIVEEHSREAMPRKMLSYFEKA